MNLAFRGGLLQPSTASQAIPAARLSADLPYRIFSPELHLQLAAPVSILLGQHASSPRQDVGFRAGSNWFEFPTR